MANPPGGGAIPTLTVHGVTVWFQRRGGDVELDARAGLEPMTSIVNNIRSGGGRRADRSRCRREFRKMLDQGGATFLMQGFACSHLSSFGPADEPHLDEARSAWLACGGAEPGEDSYVMGYSHERPSLLVPRSVLRALWEELDRLERAT